MRRRPILALLFVLLTAFAISIPLRGTGDPIEADRGPTPTVEEPSETPEPAETPTPEETEKPPRTARLNGEYPPDCLQQIENPGGSGHLAIDQENGIEITDTDGSKPVVVDDRFPFKWGPSGRYLAGGTGALYDIDGNEVGPPFPGEGPFNWSWSPIADCLIVSSSTQTLVIVPGTDAVTLHDGPLARVSFSPSGGDLAYVETADGQAHLWVASLSNGKSRRLKSFDVTENEEIFLAGWTPTGSHVLFWRGESSTLIKEGAPLLSVSSGGNVSELGTVVAHRDFVTTCEDDVIGVIGGGARVNENGKRVARLEAGSEPAFITPEDAHDVSPSCSPEADFIAVIRSESPTGAAPHRLTIIDQAGTVAFQPDDTTYRDSYPLWGRGDAGVLFLRKASGEDPEVWHVTTESSETPTGATLRAVGRNPETFRDSWGHFLDWSADQPSGVSVISEP